MEGWLYLIRFNRFGLHYSRKRHFILEDNCLKSFKSIPSSEIEEPMRSAIIDSCIRVTDNGRESHRRKVFFIFTLYNSSNYNDQLKLGATSSEEAARWIHCLQDAALNLVKNSEDSLRRIWQPFSFSNSKRMAKKISMDWTSAFSVHVDAMSSDVIAPPPWKIFGCQNGLRLFREAKCRNSKGKDWNDHPAIMAVGVIDGTSEAVFSTLMSLGPSRIEPMKRRDLLLQRCWRREDDGTYVILYHSVFHRNCPPKHGYVRARLKSGGYVITPAKQGKECFVKHMLAIDWRIWTSYLRKTSISTLVLAEHQGGFIKASSLSAIEATKSLGEGNSVTILLAGSGPSLQEAAQAASSYPSMSQVLLADSDKFTYPLAEPWAKLLHVVHKKWNYSHIVTASDSLSEKYTTSCS